LGGELTNIFNKIFSIFRENENILDVTERINQNLEELLNEFTKAEGLAGDANKSMPDGIGARISHERYAIIDATKNSEESFEKLLKILEDLEKQIKKFPSIPIDNLNDTEREIIVILSEINKIIKEAKNGAKSAIEFSKKAIINVKDDNEHARYIAGIAHGENILRISGKDLVKGGIEEVMATNYVLANKARFLAENSAKSREFREMVYKEINLLNQIISPLKEKKERLDRIINPPSEEAMISKASKQYNLGNFDAALKHYETALELNPNNEITRYNRDLVIENKKINNPIGQI
jgi:tetratricopeptide (TPR) repeat protein